ncbi:MAG: linear amide C-N hydrolase [Sedimentisphaerales bacterium]|nr:linear amide C-N hydrolase [Sedimentisphaerales bacterium]
MKKAKRKGTDPVRLAKRRRRRKIRRCILLILLVIFCGLLINPIRTLSTLEKVDDYPLYVMSYKGGYDYLGVVHDFYGAIFGVESGKGDKDGKKPEACSLFAAYGDLSRPIYGRNLDWSYSPLLVLYTNPTGGYASLSLVDIAYLGIGKTEDSELPDWGKRFRLLATPGLPFEGINEHGLTVTIALVPDLDLKADPQKETLHSLAALRMMLDNTRTTQQAIEFLENYNINFRPGPTVHYLIADAQGDRALVEYVEEGMKVIRSEELYLVATNFYLNGAGEDLKSKCWRYSTARKMLEEREGKVTDSQAMEILEKVSVGGTVWSVVYDLQQRKVHIVLARNYDKVHTFVLDDFD